MRIGKNGRSLATDVCTREEYALCRDHHIITRILPYYLGVRRQAELLGIAGNATTLPPAWLQDAEAAVGKCLNFELQLNSRLNYSIVGGITAHSVTETVESRVKLPFNIGVALFNEGYISSSLGVADPLISRAYDVDFAIGPLLPTISWPGSGEFCPPNSFEWMERHFAILRLLER